MAVDPTIAAFPAYTASILAEQWWLRHKSTRVGAPDDAPVDASADDGRAVGAVEGLTYRGYTTRDTVTSLAMGTFSLVAPLVMPRILRPITPGAGRHGRKVVAAAVVLAGVTVVADRLGRVDGSSSTAERRNAERGVVDRRIADGGQAEQPGRRLRRALRRRRVASRARRVASVTGVGAVVTGGVALSTAWAHATSPERLWRHRIGPDLGDGRAAFWAAMVGWDLIYYWNHRLMHETRALWAVHVVHHSSERYNLSTALRQPVADAFGVFIPTGLLCLAGIRPEIVAKARAWNLLYQYWIHTEVVRSIGPLEAVLNSPAAHRVHHGSNRRYLDRNHAGILIVWDRLFGTHEPEDPAEPVVYGLTKNINTYNPVRVATHEHAGILGDVATARRWRDRLGHLVAGPGWRRPDQRAA